MEQFDPFKYKSHEELPKEKQKNFKPVEDGFVRRGAMENIEEIQSDEEFLMETPEDAKKDNAKIEQCEQLLGIDKVAEIRKIIEELHEPIKKTIEQAIENIKNGDYQLLIGDDASARIPTLIFRKFINEAYAKMNLPAIQTCYLAGASSSVDKKWPNSNQYISDGSLDRLDAEKASKLNNYFNKLKNNSLNEIKQAIFVTEYVQTGNGVDRMTEALKINNIQPSVYILRKSESYGRTHEDILEDMKDMNEGTSFYIGEFGNYPQILHNERINGVIKFFADLHATPAMLNLSEDEKKIILASMTIARDEANNVADKLISELLGQKQ